MGILPCPGLQEWRRKREGALCWSREIGSSEKPPCPKNRLSLPLKSKDIQGKELPDSVPTLGVRSRQGSRDPLTLHVPHPSLGALLP